MEHRHVEVAYVKVELPEESLHEHIWKAHMLPKGTLLGYYRLSKLIGKGGMGEVYLAEDTRIPRQVAIKIVRTEAQSYLNPIEAQEASRLFKKEMRAIALLDHRNILNLIDFGEETIAGMPITYMIMPYRKEGSLSSWLQRFKTNPWLSPIDVDYMLIQAAEALQHAHDHHIIHQDVKPSNFLIRENPNDPNHPDLLLMDFGVARLTNATATSNQLVQGTPAYMPPEQWESKPVPASDQYALAVMAYQLLTGRMPFAGSWGQVMHQHIMVPPQPLSTHNPQISPAIDAVILRALEKKPEDRFPSILDFARAFHKAVSLTFPARPKQNSLFPPHPPRPGRKRPKRKLAPILLSAVLVVALVVVVIVGIVHRSNVHNDNTTATSTANANNPTATAIVTAHSDPYGAGGTLALSDPLTQAGNWNSESNTSSGGSCQFVGNGYQISESNPNGFYSCNDTSSPFDNFVFEVKMIINQGDCGGINLREDLSSGKQYVFFLCSDGTYQFALYSGYSGSNETVLKNGTTSGITSGQNTIAVIANGRNFTFYLNKSQLDNVSDSTYTQGYVGLVASPNSNATRIIYNDARIWKL